MKDKYTEQDIQDAQELFRYAWSNLKEVTGYTDGKKCECEQLTLVCPIHGCIRGSEKCSKCEGYRGFDDLN